MYYVYVLSESFNLLFQLLTLELLKTLVIIYTVHTPY